MRVYVPGGNGVPAAGPMRRGPRSRPPSGPPRSATSRPSRPGPRRRQTRDPGTVGATAADVKLSNEPDGRRSLLLGDAPDDQRLRHLPPRHEQARPARRAVHDDGPDGGRCVACHVLSRDGTKMAITYDGGDGTATMVDVGTPASASRVNSGTSARSRPTTTSSSRSSRASSRARLRDPGRRSPRCRRPAPRPRSPTLRRRHQLVYVPPVPAPTGASGGQIYRAPTTRRRTRSAPSCCSSPTREQLLPVVVAGRPMDPVQHADATRADAYNNQNASLWVVKADGCAPPVELTTRTSAPA